MRGARSRGFPRTLRFLFLIFRFAPLLLFFPCAAFAGVSGEPDFLREALEEYGTRGGALARDADVWGNFLEVAALPARELRPAFVMTAFVIAGAGFILRARDGGADPERLLQLMVLAVVTAGLMRFLPEWMLRLNAFFAENAGGRYAPAKVRLQAGEDVRAALAELARGEYGLFNAGLWGRKIGAVAAAAGTGLLWTVSTVLTALQALLLIFWSAFSPVLLAGFLVPAMFHNAAHFVWKGVAVTSWNLGFALWGVFYLETAEGAGEDFTMLAAKAFAALVTTAGYLATPRLMRALLTHSGSAASAARAAAARALALHGGVYQAAGGGAAAAAAYGAGAVFKGAGLLAGSPGLRGAGTGFFRQGDAARGLAARGLSSAAAAAGVVTPAARRPRGGGAAASAPVSPPRPPEDPGARAAEILRRRRKPDPPRL